jgi:quercetin dioxygenase-like cupin family protein
MPEEKSMKFITNLEGVPANVADLVAYQEGAVVSREIYVKEAGTLTVFAFGADQGLSEHTAPFDAFVFVLDGKVKVTIAGKPIEVSQGQIILMPANVPHALKALTPFKMLLIMMRNKEKK